jgi:hypothetical protein
MRRQVLPVQFGHQGRLAGTGVAGHQHQFGGGPGAHALERQHQCIQGRIAPVQFLRQHQPARAPARRQRERRDGAGVQQAVQAALQVGRQRAGRLVAFIRIFGQQREHDPGQHASRPAAHFFGRSRHAGQVAVDPGGRRVGHERQGPGQHLVQVHAQRVQVAACVDGPVHAPGLLGRHVSPGPGNLARRGRAAGCAVRRRDGEPGKPGAALHFVEHDMRRFQVAVHHAGRMHQACRLRQRQRRPYEAHFLPRAAQQVEQQRAARIGKGQDSAAAALRQPERHGRPGRVERHAQVPAVAQPGQRGRIGRLRRRCHQQGRQRSRTPRAAPDGDIAFQGEQAGGTQQLRHGR